MSYPEYGPGLNGWPAHGFTDMRDSHVVCYCGAEFTSKMALNQHAEAEARRAALTSLRERVAGLPWTVDQSYRAASDEERLQAAEVSRAAVLAEIDRALEP